MKKIAISLKDKQTDRGKMTIPVREWLGHSVDVFLRHLGWILKNKYFDYDGKKPIEFTAEEIRSALRSARFFKMSAWVLGRGIVQLTKWGYIVKVKKNLYRLTDRSYFYYIKSM